VAKVSDVIPTTLGKVLEATGYFEDGKPAPGVLVDDDARSARRGRRFAPDALWRGPSALTVYFKYVSSIPEAKEIAVWRQEIWNEGFSPLLWVVSPAQIVLYNGFARPLKSDDVSANRLNTFTNIEIELRKLDELAGRFAMETGQFWLRQPSVSRKTAVDQQLLRDLATLENDLVTPHYGLDRGTAQGLIGRAIFSQYLVDRGIVDQQRLLQHSGQPTLPGALRVAASAQSLFKWLRSTFNGDMFPESMPLHRLELKHFNRIAEFLEAIDPKTGQGSLFPYQFDVIPVELISSIYEQFAHSGSEKNSNVTSNAKTLGVHYTRLPLVSLVLDEVMDGATGDESVLDLTCGSGVFLVEAFRRLVMAKSNGNPSRSVIREVLYGQVYGVDITEAAVRVAAFSLYLAALELDPDPYPAEALKFKELIGNTLFVGNARNIETTPAGAGLALRNKPRQFDLIVGNPPWTFKGKDGTIERRKGSPVALQPRGEGFDFVLRALDFSHEKTRFGIILSAMPFFAGSRTGAAAARHVIEKLSPATLVNLAPLVRWLFPTAKNPAVALLARCRSQPTGQLTVVNVPWSPSGEKSQTFEISPSDIFSLSLSDWERTPELLKVMAFGRSRDVALLGDLRDRFSNLGEWLKDQGTTWRDGLILGKVEQRTRSAAHLSGLNFLDTKSIQHFSVPPNLPRFMATTAQWPRERATYTAPLLLIKEFYNKTPRALTAVAGRDLVYTDAYFGVALTHNLLDAAHLISMILSSSLASWYFLMTASEFGVWKRRLLTRDVGKLPIPQISQALESDSGKALLALRRTFFGGEVSAANWLVLDSLVADLYSLDNFDRAIVQDGLCKASWQWEEGRDATAEPATIDSDLRPYAEMFLSGMDVWLEASGMRSMKAELYDLPKYGPLRVIRFVLQERSATPKIEVIQPVGELAEVLKQIGRRLSVQITSALVGEREVRVHAKNEVIIIKPAARRFWMKSSALEDVDAIITESYSGAAA
jgi:N-6 DNA Methylase